jgi:hypothetical protein
VEHCLAVKELKWEMGNGKWEMGNGKWLIWLSSKGNDKLTASISI